MKPRKTMPNSFGFSDEVWATLTPREKQRLREQRYRDKLRQEPEAYTELRRREYRRQAEYRAENREVRNAKHADYKRRNAEAMKVYDREYQRRRTARKQMQRSPERIYRDIIALLPRGLPTHMRDDVVGSVCLQVLEGRVRHDRMADAVRDALKQHNRMFDHFKTISLDAPVAGSDDMTLLDKLASVK